MRSLLLLLPLLVLLPNGASADYWLEQWVTGLSSPLCVAAPPGDGDRLFLVEQGGRIRIFENGSLNAVPFLDVSSITSSGGERGLLGLAFHPDYASNGWFYINHTGTSSVCDGAAGCTIVARYTVSGDPDIADAGGREEIIEIAQPFGNHNGGGIEFGPDGYLYIGMGDGGSGGDPQNNGQNDGRLLGKMLRLDVDSGLPYSIPPDNPHIGAGDPLDEIWAKGLRNPWRFSFDRLTGDLWIGDVGQNAWEEIDFQSAASVGGENYGWRLMEGAHCFNPPSNCDPGSLTYPIWEYSHGGGNCSVTGGYVYRGTNIPELIGRYIFADYCTGDFWAFDRSDSSNVQILSDQFVGNVTSFGEDAAGELYVTAGTKVWKFVGTTTGAEDFPGAQGGLRFGPTHPNPFTGEMRVSLRLASAAGSVDVGVYSVDGRRVATLHSGAAGGDALPLLWDGRDSGGNAAPSGVYFLRANGGGESATSRVVLLR